MTMEGPLELGNIRLILVDPRTKKVPAVKVNLLAAFKVQRWRLQERYSEEGIELIQKSVFKKSTNLYKYKWNVFADFCEESNFNPFEASETDITNLFAFTKKHWNLGYSAIC